MPTNEKKLDVDEQTPLVGGDIKIRFNQETKAWSSIHSALVAGSETWDAGRGYSPVQGVGATALARQKTQLVVKTVEEASDILHELDYRMSYSTDPRGWGDAYPSEKRCWRRVRSELVNELRDRGYDIDRDPYLPALTHPEADGFDYREFDRDEEDDQTVREAYEARNADDADDTLIADGGGEFTDVLANVRERIAEIESDERLHYEDANVRVNAPLALHQASQKAALAELKQVESMLSDVVGDEDDEGELVTDGGVSEDMVDRLTTLDDGDDVSVTVVHEGETWELTGYVVEACYEQPYPASGLYVPGGVTVGIELTDETVEMLRDSDGHGLRDPTHSLTVSAKERRPDSWDAPTASMWDPVTEDGHVLEDHWHSFGTPTDVRQVVTDGGRDEWPSPTPYRVVCSECQIQSDRMEKSDAVEIRESHAAETGHDPDVFEASEPMTDDYDQSTLRGERVERPACQPPHYPDRTCESDVSRVITVYYGKGPVSETIMWRVCDEHADEVREHGDEIRDDRPYRETVDGFDLVTDGD